MCVFDCGQSRSSGAYLVVFDQGPCWVKMWTRVKDVILRAERTQSALWRRAGVLEVQEGFLRCGEKEEPANALRKYWKGVAQGVKDLAPSSAQPWHVPIDRAENGVTQF